MLTISGLIARTGVPRTSIHFYLREGLLPRPYKSAPNRSFYTEDHVRLLLRIGELKQAGMTLADIRTSMAEDLTGIEGQDADFIGRENERIRKTILRVATEEFRDRGYEQARVADIIRKAGVSSQVFYSFFPSKGELLVESFKTLLTWNVAAVEQRLKDADPGERLLERTHAGTRMYEFELSVLSLIRAEVRDGNADVLAQRVEQAWAPIMSAIGLEFQNALRQGVKAPVSLELLAYSLLGALHYAMMRATWDDRFSPEDMLTTHVWLFLTVLDALGRQTDPDPFISRYGDLIREVAARGPEAPSLPDD